MIIMIIMIMITITFYEQVWKWAGIYDFGVISDSKANVHMSNFSCTKLSAEPQSPLFELICIEFTTWKVRRLNLV